MEDFNDLNNELNLDNQPQSPKPMGVFGILFSKMTSDMKFLGMFYIIYGVISSLSIIGAIIGIPLLISGLRIREAADELSIFKDTNEPAALKRGFELQGKFFRIHKIIILVSFILTLLYFVIAFFFIGSLISSD